MCVMSCRDLWEALHQRFDPEVPAQQPGWRADRPLSPAEAIGKAVDPSRIRGGWVAGPAPGSFSDLECLSRGLRSCGNT